MLTKFLFRCKKIIFHEQECNVTDFCYGTQPNANSAPLNGQIKLRKNLSISNKIKHKTVADLLISYSYNDTLNLN